MNVSMKSLDLLAFVSLDKLYFCQTWDLQNSILYYYNLAHKLAMYLEKIGNAIIQFPMFAFGM